MNLKGVVMDEISISRALSRISHEIIERNKGVSNLVLLGIVSRGEPMSMLLQEKIGQLENVKVPIGKLDITPFRDDLTANQNTSDLTKIDFSVTDKDIVLCDDVMYTGRTVRSAIDAIMSLGRPKSIQLAVLVDRGHRELPIRADYIGKNIPTARSEEVVVKIKPYDNEQSVSIFG